MTVHPDIKPLNRRQILALRGLRLPVSALRSLRQSGILCDPSVSIVSRKLPDTYVIRARESGGAVAHIGAYCGFVAESGELLSWTDRVENVGRNGFHSLVLATKLVRVHVLRFQESYDLLITRHRLMCRPGRKRPLLENAILFHGVRGRFAEDGEEESRGDLLPAFDDGFGKPISVPGKFQQAAILAIQGTRCTGCNHTHLLQASSSLRRRTR